MPGFAFVVAVVVTAMRRVLAISYGGSLARSSSSSLRARRAEDPIPCGGVLRKEPAFELPPIAEVEDAHDARLDVDPSSSSAHVAERADMLVVPEHVVLPQPEPDLGQPSQPHKKILAASNVPGSRVVARNVPDDILVDEGLDTWEVSGAKCIGGSPVRGRVRVLFVHGYGVVPPSPCYFE